MKKLFTLKSIHPNAPDVAFTFNVKTGRVSGKDAKKIQHLIQMARKGGVNLMPCYNHKIEGAITERKLAIILTDWYDIDGVLPPINLTDEEVYGEGQDDFSDDVKDHILY